MHSSSRWVSAAVLIFSVTAAVFAQSSVPAKKTSKKRAATSATQQDVQLLRSLFENQQQQLAAQSQQLDQLKSQLQQVIDAAQQANSNAQKVQSSVQQAQQSAAEAQRLADQASANAVEAKTALAVVNTKEQADAQKVSALSDILGRFRFSGDVRMRGESIFQSAPGFVDRNRARIRARFGFDSKLNEDFSAGIFLATGSPADLTSANETLTNFFERKTIGVDRAFISYQPVAHKWLQLTGGKFAYTWTRTSLTFDPDINPEGFSEKLSWDINNPVLKNFTLGALQLVYNEVSAGTDSYALGGQAGAKFQLGPWTATPQFLALKWNNPSAILQASAFAVQATKGTDSAGDTISLPGEGPGCASGSAGSSKLPASAPCALASNGFTNAVFTDARGTPRLLSGFFYTDYLLHNEFKTGAERFPVNLVLEYQQNLRAASHPLDTKGKVIPGLGPQNKGYLADISIGRTKERNDLQFGYGYWRQEQDAILATFSESEQRASTNILEHRVYGSWKMRRNALAQFSLWRGRTLDSNVENNAALTQKSITKPGQVEPYLNRYQFDLIYNF